MIPLKLQLKNFLSYGEAPVIVDFEPYHLLCLSGKNGHGKSALLDAITWALWGQARKMGGVARDDARLIRLGQKHMQVIFDFICNGQRMRVKRELTFAYEKTYTTLDFGLFDAAKQAMVPLTDKTIRQTQSKIESLIGFTYESFTNSVFLRQGQSNEFSRKSAKERKDVLAAILGLGTYDAARAQALDRARLSVEECERVRAQRAQLSESLARQGELQVQLLAGRQRLASVQEQETQLSAQNELLRTKREAWYQAKERVGVIQAQVQGLKDQLQACALSGELAGVQERKTKELACAQAKSQLQALIDKRNYHEQRLQVLDRDLAVLVRQRDQAMQQSAQKEVLEQRFGTAQRLFDRRKELYHRMVGYAHWVNKELADTRQRVDQSTDQMNPRCPLCRQNLDRAIQVDLEQRLCVQARFFEHRLARVAGFLKASKPQLVLQQAEIAACQDELTRVQTAIAQGAELCKRYDALGAERAALERDCALLAVQEERVRKQVAGFEKALEQMDAQMQQRLVSDTQYQELSARLLQTEAQLGTSTAGDIAEQDQALKKEEAVYAQGVRAVQDERASLLQQVGRLERELELLAAAQGAVQALDVTLARLESVALEYRAIADALGKDGIQALLIEAVVPEIEAGANALLARLSDQNAQIMIESLRDLKRGGSRETLDIHIADNAGIRPYELFSGGEAFRIDFALRIAISQLLARRAGAALQTLIIDEGFGSQDDDGLQLIMDALYRVQNDFAKIIVVSHLPALKDQFPVHLQVDKGPQGSTISVIENN